MGGPTTVAMDEAEVMVIYRNIQRINLIRRIPNLNPFSRNDPHFYPIPNYNRYEILNRIDFPSFDALRAYINLHPEWEFLGIISDFFLLVNHRLFLIRFIDCTSLKEFGISIPIVRRILHSLIHSVALKIAMISDWPF